MGLPLYHVDAFTDRAFAGNPAAVCLLDESREDGWMAAVAAEMNLSETAFVLRRSDGDFDLRWFTPAVEVDLCGHATLASAHVLWTEGVADIAAPIRFHTRSGVLVAERDGEAIELDFPATPPEPTGWPAGLAEALGVPPERVLRSRFDVVAVLPSAEAVATLRPDVAALGRVDARGIIVTARGAGRGTDFVSRFFGPAVGVDEDPVTGSAHCALAPFWARELGRTEMVGYQASARGGTVRVRLVGDRVRLGGRAVTVARGELAV